MATVRVKMEITETLQHIVNVEMDEEHYHEISANSNNAVGIDLAAEYTSRYTMNDASYDIDYIGIVEDEESV